MLTMSPAFLLFPALELEGSVRKEFLALAAVALLALMLRSYLSVSLVYIAALVFGIGALSHEANALALPAVLFLLLEIHRRRMISGRVLWPSMGFAVISSITSLTIAASHSGSSRQRIAICDAVIARTSDPNLCVGAIEAIDDGFRDSVSTVSTLFPLNFNYLGLIALSLLPFMLFQAPRRFWYLVGITYAALIPLFVVGVDYGRWIFLATGLLSFVALGTFTSEARAPLKVPLIAALAYVSLWTLPYLSLWQPAPLAQVLELVYVPLSQWVGSFIPQ